MRCNMHAATRLLLQAHAPLAAAAAAAAGGQGSSHSTIGLRCDHQVDLGVIYLQRAGHKGEPVGGLVPAPDLAACSRGVAAQPHAILHLFVGIAVAAALPPARHVAAAAAWHRHCRLPCQSLLQTPSSSSSMAAPITGKTIVVVGGSRGIGAEFVRQFAAKGNRVLAACRCALPCTYGAGCCLGSPGIGACTFRLKYWLSDRHGVVRSHHCPTTSQPRELGPPTFGAAPPLLDPTRRSNSNTALQTLALPAEHVKTQEAG